MRRLTAVVAATSLFSCRPATVEEALHALRADSYTKTLEAGEHRLEFRFIPETLYYLTFAPQDGKRTFSEGLLDSLKDADSGGYGLMFSMVLSPRLDTLAPTDYRNDVVFGQIAKGLDYRKLLQEFQFGLKAKIHLEAGGRRFELANYHMTNSWGMSKSRTFTLVFPVVQDVLPDGKGKVVLVVEDLVPGQGKDKLEWNLPLSGIDFVRG